jgi:acetylornithine deacetylase
MRGPAGDGWRRTPRMRDPVVSLAADLVAIPSVNPSLSPAGAGEQAIATYLAEHMRRAGLDVEQPEALPGRPNVVAVMTGASPGPTVLFCGHTDTVGTDGMDAPFDPVVRDGRLYGRGAQDMKGGLAAMVHAATTAARDGRVRRGRLVVAAVVDEEYASAGADAIAPAWRADAVVIPEPTDLQVGVAHRGFSAAEIVMHGRAAHGSRPADGRDAILRMGRVLARLEARDRWLQAQPPQPFVGTGSLHASVIEGGGELSSYPARCRLQYERRTLPGEVHTIAADDLAALVAGLAAEDPELTADVRLLLARPAYAIDPGHPVVARLLAACAASGVASAPCGVSFWTDAAVLGPACGPAVLFGPGGEGLHSPTEYVRTDHVVQCRDALLRFVEGWCG